MAPPARPRPDLEALVRRAAPMQHVAPADARDAAPALIAARLTRWRDVAAAGEESRFAKRLQWDGLDEADARAMVAGALGTAGDGRPSWLEIVASSYGWDAGRPPLALQTSEWPGVVDPTLALPFEELMLPLVETARARLARDLDGAPTVLPAPVLGTLLRGLLRRLSDMCAIALYADFSVHLTTDSDRSLAFLFGDAGATPSAAYQRFIETALDAGMLPFFERYPVMARLCGTVTELWGETMREFIGRLRDDLPAFGATFFDGRSPGAIEAIQADAGDTHEGGRTVFVLCFATGARLVYKPRAIPLEDCFGRLVDWLEATGGTVALRVPRRLSRATHGWIEFVDTAPCADDAAADRFYERTGALLALVYALNGTDFHSENLIAAGEHPVLIDMEALLSHRFELEDAPSGRPPALAEASERVRRSVLRSCLLPGHFIGRNGGTDIGGLAAGRESEDAVPVLVWRDVNTDAMKLVQHAGANAAPATHLPVLRGQALDAADHVDAIVNGFRSVYRHLQTHREQLLAHDGPLAGMRHAPVRFLFRHTNLYATLLRRTLHPEFLRDGVERGIQLEALARPLLATESRPACWPLLSEEMRALEQLDVPLFSAVADSTGIRIGSPATDAMVHCFETTAFDQVTARVASLSDEELARELHFIRAAFVASRGHGLAVSSAGAALETPADQVPAVHRIATAALVAEAREVADETLRAASWSSGDGPAWFTINYVPFARRYAIGAAGTGVADGISGIALFLAAASRLTPGDALREAAESTAGMIASELRGFGRTQRARRRTDLGLGSGIGGTMYAAVLLADWLAQPELASAAARAAMELEPETIAADTNRGLFSGNAGAIVGLLAVHRASGSAAALENAIRCGRHLLDTRRPHRISRLRGWATWDGQSDTGFAQGLGGIAAALHSLARASGVAEFAEAGEEAIALERWVLGNELANVSATAAWCRGSIALGAARLALPGEWRDALAMREIEDAITVARTGVAAGPDTLCNGGMGRAEFLLYAGERLQRPELVDAARQIGAALLRRRRTAGRWQTPWDAAGSDVGFSHGLSGIGYQCLRLAAPDRFPSVLHWSSDVAPVVAAAAPWDSIGQSRVHERATAGAT